jgi:hypothetical protein
VKRLVAIAKRLPLPVQHFVVAMWERLGVPRFLWLAKFRTVRAYGVGRKHPLLAARYVVLDPELDNFTYELGNEDELISFVSESLGRSSAEIGGYLQEISTDRELAEALRRRLRRRFDHKRKPLFGRRLGWYAIARALMPSVIVETGIHDGLGSALLLRAAARNAENGGPGRVISVDVNARAGWLVPDELRGHWTPIVGSSFDVLEDALAGLEVGMIIHDSDHTYDCERFEFSAAVAHAAPTIALVSDNAHATSALRDVCASLGIEYRFFAERPVGHFYPGAGIGFGLLERMP